ncbi:MAG: methylisocitrate lyase [Thaumarchaeota archaeon]|nr:methylisocitrate lyase [Nitrososphaerota archaeon]
MRETSADPSARLRDLISSDGCTAVPGVFSPAVALLAEKAGFRALYFSGGAFSGLLGLPDLGVTTLTEVATAVTQISSRVRLPMIVDVDTGFGEAVNMGRTVVEMERAGAAAIQVEDQVMPKRCGHLEGKQLVSEEEMVKKLIAAREASAKGLVIVARTDAASIEGIDSAVERARLYVRAGADVIFPEALRNVSEFREFAGKVRIPLLANMTEFGKTDYIPVSEFEKLGYKLVIFPVTTFRVMMKSVQDALGELAATGTQKGLLKEMLHRDEFYDLIGYRTYEAVDGETARKAKKILDTN